jgi:hypothetical protein
LKSYRIFSWLLVLRSLNPLKVPVITKESHIIVVPKRKPVKTVYVKHVIEILEVIINEEYTEES